MARKDSKAQLGLSQDGAALGECWLEPFKGGYNVMLGASKPGERLAFVQKDTDGWHINRLDLMDTAYPSAIDAATAAHAHLKSEKKI